MNPGFDKFATVKQMMSKKAKLTRINDKTAAIDISNEDSYDPESSKEDQSKTPAERQSKDK